MTRMLCRQIYISWRRRVQLKRLATAHGVSKAEVIRQEIEWVVFLTASQPTAGGRSALEELLLFGPSGRAVDNAVGRAWTRNDLPIRRTLMPLQPFKTVRH